MVGVRLWASCFVLYGLVLFSILAARSSVPHTQISYAASVLSTCSEGIVMTYNIIVM